MKYWYLAGLLHREDGPAVEDANGDKHWYLQGLLHREDGPASIYSDGTKKWYLNGFLSREGGPAVEGSNSVVRERHYRGMPLYNGAIFYFDGIKNAYLDDKFVSVDKFYPKSLPNSKATIDDSNEDIDWRT